MALKPSIKAASFEDLVLGNMEEMIIWLCHTLRRGWDGGVLMLGW
jgi:hypothetical protein